LFDDSVSQPLGLQKSRSSVGIIELMAEFAVERGTTLWIKSASELYRLKTAAAGEVPLR
jgi:hypothetical protein